jgi:hypothetical protein
MQTLSDSASALAAAAASSAPNGVPTWKLTDAVRQLRLALADASLRARDDARRLPRTDGDHWFAVGRAQGFQEAALILRDWTHPFQHEAVLAHLHRAAQVAHATRERIPASHPRATQMRAFHSARAWALRWTLNQVGELDAHAHGLS